MPTNKPMLRETWVQFMKQSSNAPTDGHCWRLLQHARTLPVVLGLFTILACDRKSNDEEPETPTPPPVVVTEEDPSELTGPTFGELPEGLTEANHGAFEGGATGTPQDAAQNNVLPKTNQRDAGYFNVPSNGTPSPLFGAEAFSQKLMRFEEFGPESLDLEKGPPGGDWISLPIPSNFTGVPDGDQIETFLSQEIWPNPTQYANTEYLNPWEKKIEGYLGRELAAPPAEGRPPGLGWSHQRWDEFPPVTGFQTATTGARVNGGFRDSKQMHGYAAGEFGPGGLYHNTTGAEGFDGTTAVHVEVRFHPDMPVQNTETLWTFDGTFPPKLLNVRYGEGTCDASI